MTLADGRGVTFDVAVVTISQPRIYAGREVHLVSSDRDRAFWENAVQKPVRFEMEPEEFERLKRVLADDRHINSFNTFQLRNVALKPSPDSKPPVRPP